MSAHAIPMIGHRFGRLIVIARDMSRKGKEPYWSCRCDCGKTISTRGTCLRSQVTQSCGCLGIERGKSVNTKHGQSYSYEYRIWKGIRQRCCNKSDKAYPDYGGRGITMCDRWRNDFSAFIADMGPRPSLDHSVERKNNDGNYCPENCIWATQKAQCRNKRTNRILDIDGQRRCIAEWAEIYGLPHGVVTKRLDRGWSAEKALTTPVAARIKLEVANV